MKYFTRAQHDAINMTDNGAIAAAMEEFKKNAELYREQLGSLRSRLSSKAQKFFETVSLHDGTLQKLSVGEIVVKLAA